MPSKVIDGKAFTVRPDRVDFRDFPYRPPLRSLPAEYPAGDLLEAHVDRYTLDEMILNQGKYGACTGFALAGVINYLRWERELVSFQQLQKRRGSKKGRWVAPKKVSESMLYLNARLYDEWAGDDYEGSSCRGAMKGWHKHGVCLQETWPYSYANKKKKTEDGPGLPGSVRWRDEANQIVLGAYYRIDEKSVVDMQAAIYEVHAVYVAAEAHNGWTAKRMYNCPTFDNSVIGPPSAKSDTGGHAFAIVGYNKHGFIVQNSWGSKWGYLGFALLPYEDWIKNGYDAWALALGAPIASPATSRAMPESSAQARSPVGLSALALQERVRGPAGWSLLRPGREARPELPAGMKAWSDDDVAHHSIVSTVDGAPVRQLVTARSAVESVQVVARNILKVAKQEGCEDIAIVIHGGLNSKNDGLIRTGFMGPWLLANKIVPVFPIWQSDATSSLLGAALEALGLDEIAKWILARGASAKPEDKALDRHVEDIARHSPGKAAWSEMKNKAEGLSQRNGALRILVSEIAAASKPPNIHLIGHSAGAVAVGHALDMLQNLQMKAKTVTLYAPACTVAFANRKFGDHLNVGTLEKLHIDYLSDERERKDACVRKLGLTLYSKSLLYLVSRAFESEHKTPLLGFEWAVDHKRTIGAIRDSDVFRKETLPEIESWRTLAEKFGVSATCWETETVTVTKKANPPHVNKPNVHGSFDNNVDCVNQTISRIRGRLDVPVTDLDFGGD